jgi:hypothetical protein
MAIHGDDVVRRGGLEDGIDGARGGVQGGQLLRASSDVVDGDGVEEPPT